MSSLTSLQTSSKPGVISFGLSSQDVNSPGPPAFKESKVKKQGTTVHVHTKKPTVSTSNHHSSTLHSPSQEPKPYASDSMTWLNDMVSWPDRRNSTGVEGTTSKKKSVKEKDRDHDRSSRMESDQLPFLPDLGIDGKSSRLGGHAKNTKKSSVSIMPHITSITPFHNGQGHQAQSPPGYHDGRGPHDSNLPSV